MPTARPRHQVTETPEVAQALDAAARRWPGEARSKLLLRLIHAGALTLDEARHEVVRGRLEAIEASAGKYTDLFGENYLGELREDWPA